MVEKMSWDPQRTFLYLSTDSETGDTGRYIYRLFIVRLYFSLHYKSVSNTPLRAHET